MSSTGRTAVRSAEQNTGQWRTSPESAVNAGRPSLFRQTPLAGQNIARNAVRSGKQDALWDLWGSLHSSGKTDLCDLWGKAVAENGEIVISANREGMLSLAKHLTALADGIPGDHIHYDVNNSLEDGSTEMIIERTR